MPDLCWLNGRIVEVSSARISPLDRGLLFGDGVYEVVRVAGGVALRLGEHLARLRRSLAAVEIPEPPGLPAACAGIVSASALRSGSLLLQVTRGAAARAHIPPRAMEPTVLLLPAAHEHAPAGAQPLRAVTMEDPRWARCDLKTTSLMGIVLGKLQARAARVEEVLFLGSGGALREGGSTNLFVRRAGALESHPLDGRVLPGITRAAVLRWCRELGMRVSERAPQLGEQSAWQEAFLCGTLTGIQPLVEVDRTPVADRAAGEWTRRIAAAYEEENGRLIAAEEIFSSGAPS